MCNFKEGDRVEYSLNQQDYDNDIFDIGIVEKIREPLVFIKIVDDQTKPIKVKFVRKAAPIVTQEVPVKKEPRKIGKILIVKDKLEPGNAHLPVPLVPGEKCIVLGLHEQDNKYVKVKHNHGKTTSTFHLSHFQES